MIKLIFIELNKLFHKKSIYIIWGLLFIFCLINNVLYKLDYDEEGYYINDYIVDNTEKIKKLESDLNNYNKFDSNDVSMYISLKTELDLLNLKKKYNEKSWQYARIDYLKDDIYNINYYTYYDKNSIKLDKYLKKYEEKIKKFQDNDWQYFVKIDINELKEIISTEENSLKNVTDELEKSKLKKSIEDYQNELKILEMRLENNISYGINYLNDALNKYSEAGKMLNNYSDVNNLNYEDKLEYNELISTYNVNKYTINNKINLNQENNLNYLLRTVIEDYELFVIIIILMVSGSIVSEEFNKGTIKLLLIKPFSRSKILLSKYLVSILTLIITIVLAILLEFIIGGYLFGFDSLKMSVASYNFNSNIVECYNVFEYMFIRIGYNLPFLIMILTISFCIGVVSSNTVLAVTLTMLIYMFSDMINELISKSSLTYLKYFLTVNWDFRNYMINGLGVNEYVNFKFSIFVYAGYLLLFLLIAFVVFKKKNIRNI